VLENAWKKIKDQKVEIKVTNAQAEDLTFTPFPFDVVTSALIFYSLRRERIRP
jgi:ubiquinone/menaquinone biosynthesis C-methylase UbiE